MIDKIKTRPLLGLKVFATACGYSQITNGDESIGKMQTEGAQRGRNS